MMRIVGFAIALAPLVLTVTACTRATAIGTPCLADKDCNVAGQKCVAGLDGGAKICTHPCTGQSGTAGCPVGYDCSAADPANPTTFTCNREKYAFDASSGAPLLFDKDCSLQGGTTQAEWDTACANTGDPAPNPTCRHAADPDARAAPIRNDAHAYCTGGCNSDNDCPVDMYCGADYDGKTKCIRRGFCDPCWMNDNCTGENDACVPTADGSSRYCTKSCGSPYDCGGVQGTFLSCSTSTDSLGASAMYCLHKFGACVGTGQICDPCRVNADCAASGTNCVSNLATHERMCTKPCTMDSECASDKPTGCDFGPPPSMSGDPRFTDYCTGDANHFNPGVFTCFF